MIDTLDKRLNLITSGNFANVAYEKFSSVVMLHQENLLAAAKAEFRAGNLSDDKKVALFGGLCALDDLISILEQQIKAGRNAEKKGDK